MKSPKYVLSVVLFLATINLVAQNINPEPNAQNKLPVQAFAAMPVIFGVSIENAFSHDRKYKTFAENDLTLPFKSGQNYSIFGSMPIVRKWKGLSVKANFNFDIFKDNIEDVRFNEEVLIEDVEKTATSAYAALNVSQEIVFKKWKKKLILSGTVSSTGKIFYGMRNYRALLNANLPLKVTPNTMFMVGAVGIFGKNVQRPVLPIVVYFTRLGEHLNLEMILPVSAQLRYVVSNKSSVTMGAKLFSRTPFMDMELPIPQSTGDALEFKSQNFRYYINAEKALNKLVWINAEVGYNQNRKAIINTPNQDLRNKLFVGTGFGYAYAKIGVFIRPVFGTKKE